MNTLRVAIVTDEYHGDDPDIERQEIASTLHDYLSELVGDFSIRVVATGRGTHQVVRKDFDLLVIDYGMAAASGSMDMGRWQVQEACEWALEHPGRLLVLWTSFTKLIYDAELKVQFGHIDNMVAHYATPHYSDNQTAHDAFIETIARWFWPERFANGLHETPKGPYHERRE